MKLIHSWLGGIACALAVFAMGCAADGNERSTGQVVDDTAILTKTKTALFNDPVVSGMAINVDVDRGVVKLHGTVKSDVEKMKAGEIAGGVDGVMGVNNELIVSPPVKPVTY